MKSLMELQSEIRSLQKQAAELRTREFAKTVAEIAAKMTAFGITLRHLKDAIKKSVAPQRGRPRGATKPKQKAAGKAKRVPKAKAGKVTKKAAKGTRRPAAIKYRGPAGETWSGRGKTPTWLRTLVESGKSTADYKI